MGDKTRGLFNKFVVRRVGGKRYGSDYFVLDLAHDPHALPALSAYADSCAAEYPLLAADLRVKVRRAEVFNAIDALRAQCKKENKRD